MLSEACKMTNTPKIKGSCGGWRTEENKMEGTIFKKSSLECGKSEKNGIYYSSTKRSLSTIAFILFAAFVATAQIKMVDETFKTNTDSISVLKAAIDFDKVFPKYNGTHFNDKFYGGLRNEYSDEVANPVGEKIFLCESIEGFCKVGEKYVVGMIPANKYYTYTGFIFGYDNLDSLVTSWRGHGIREWYDEKCDALDNYLQVNKSRKFTTEEFKEFGYERGNITDYIQLFILEDEGHNQIYYNVREQENDNDLRDIKMIPVSFYENVSAGLKNKNVGIINERSEKRVNDAISGELIEIESTNFKQPTFGYQCTDVVAKNGKVLAVLSDGSSSFAVPIYEIKYRSLADLEDYHIKYGDWEYGSTSFEGEGLFLYIKDGYEDFCQLKKETEEAQKKKLEAVMAENAKKAEERKQKILDKYGQDLGGKILEGKVAIGMTKEMCLEAGWFPFRGTESLETAVGKIEVWTCFNSKLTFVGGKLTAIRRK